MKNVEKSKLKSTDIGFIPVDWDIKSYGEVFDFLSTISNPREDLCIEGDFGYIHYGDIHTQWENTLDLSKNDLPNLSRDKIKKLPPFLKDGDLVMADASEDSVGVAKTVEIKNIGKKKVFSGLHTFLMRDRNAVFSDGFRGYIHEIPAVRQQIQKVATGLKVFGVSKNTLKNILIPIPKPDEQKAIAAALSDVDGLIESIEQLIAKKRDMKTAAMQQLLTGKKRLPGFTKKQGYKNTDIGLIPVDWDVMPISSLCEIVSGGTPSTTNPTYWFKGSIPWCTPTDITGTAGKYLYQTDRNITTLGLSKSSANLLPAGSLLLCSRATIGVLKIANTQIATNQGFKSLVCHSVDTEFMYYKVLTLKDKFVQLAIGSTFLEIHKKDIAGLCLNVPKIEEQKAIATILSDMDTEINALEQRLAKAKSIKAGMMQELLTGRTRLVKPAKSAK